MSKDAPLRDIRRVEKKINAIQKGEKLGKGSEIEADDYLVSFLISGGPTLPPTSRADSLKASLLARGMELEKGVMNECVLTSGRAGRVKPLSRLSILKIATALTLIALMLAAIGLGSAYAMPSNPLYSVKRAVESIYLWVIPGDRNKANAYASWTDRRLGELEYVSKREIVSWYYPLMKDIQAGIENVYRKAKSLGGEEEKEFTRKAKALTFRFEKLLGKVKMQMKRAQKVEAERAIERLRLQLREREGASGGVPSRQSGEESAPTNYEGNSNTQQSMQQENQQRQTQEGQGIDTKEPFEPTQQQQKEQKLINQDQQNKQQEQQDDGQQRHQRR